MAVLAIDMGGSSIKAGIVENGTLLAATQVPAQSNASVKENLERAHEVLENLMSRHSVESNTLDGIGVALPSIVDSEKQLVVSRYVKYHDAAAFDFSAWAKEKWNLPLVLENDARAALVGEWQYGAGKGYDTIAMITLGTGMGSAVLLNGKLLKGRNFIAGNLWGHTSVNLYGKDCTCGFTGCLETEASAWVLKDKFSSMEGHEGSSLFGKDLSFTNVFAASESGDETAKRMVSECVHAWSVCAVNMVHAYDPQVIIFSGGVMEQDSIILTAAQSFVDKYAWLPQGSVKLVKGEQAMYGSLLGLGYLLKIKIKG